LRHGELVKKTGPSLLLAVLVCWLGSCYPQAPGDDDSAGDDDTAGDDDSAPCVDSDGDGFCAEDDCNDADSSLNGPSTYQVCDQAPYYIVAPDAPDLAYLRCCNQIQGDLTISGPSLADLSALAPLKDVFGALSILNTNLPNLGGLDNLRYVYDLVIDDNDALVHLGGLENLGTVNGSLSIRDNLQLSDLGALTQLWDVGEHLQIERNDALTGLDGLQGLSQVGWDLLIWDNNVLTGLDGLQGLSQVGSQVGELGDLSIWENDRLSSLAGLASLTSIDGDLEISSNVDLQRLFWSGSAPPAVPIFLAGSFTCTDNGRICDGDVVHLLPGFTLTGLPPVVCGNGSSLPVGDCSSVAVCP